MKYHYLTERLRSFAAGIRTSHLSQVWRKLYRLGHRNSCSASYIKNRRYDSELLIDFNPICFFLKYKYRQTNCFSWAIQWPPQLTVVHVLSRAKDNLDVDILKEREKLSPANIHMIDHKADKIVYSNK